VNIRTVENTAALEAQLLAGQVDMIAGRALACRSTRRRRCSGRCGTASASSPARLVLRACGLNLDNPLLADRRVRQALIQALDRRQITQRLY
jgi:peptide/nickel transport system substrate-binding protein